MKKSLITAAATDLCPAFSHFLSLVYVPSWLWFLQEQVSGHRGLNHDISATDGFNTEPSNWRCHGLISPLKSPCDRYVYQSSASWQCDNERGVAHCDEPTESSPEPAAPLGFTELCSEFQLLILPVWFSASAASSCFQGKSFKTGCTAPGQQQTVDPHGQM